MFGRYVQFNAHALQGGGGSGLGLWLSKQIVEMHGGMIGAWSEGEGKGSVFYCMLPVDESTVVPSSHVVYPMVSLSRMSLPSIAEVGSRSSGYPSQVLSASVCVDEDEEGPLSPREGVRAVVAPVSKGAGDMGEEQAAPALQTLSTVRTESGGQQEGVSGVPRDSESSNVSVSEGRGRGYEGDVRVLVVDDGAVNRKMVIRALQKMSVVVDEAENGEEALRLVGQSMVHDRPYDIIFMDNCMPKMNGLEASRALRDKSGPYRYEGQIVGVTGNVLAAEIEEYLEAGANRVLGKPLAVSTIRDLIAST